MYLEEDRFGYGGFSTNEYPTLFYIMMTKGSEEEGGEERGVLELVLVFEEICCLCWNFLFVPTIPLRPIIIPLYR